jgi:hypothetical protein
MHCDGSSPLFVAKVSQDIVAATQPFASTSASQLSERPTHSFLCWMHFVVVQNITGTAYLTCAKGKKKQQRMADRLGNLISSHLISRLAQR